MLETRLVVVLGVLLFVGATLLLSEFRWFKRPSLTARLRPFANASMDVSSRSTASFSEALTPLANAVGSRISALFGVKGDLGGRMRRAHMTGTTASAFRLRQLLYAGAAFAGSALVIAAVRPPMVMAILFLVGLPLLAFLLLEQQVSQAAERRAQKLFTELPVMSEQLAMLLGAGFSLGSAINRIGERSGGVVAEDLRTVRDRMRHGLPVEQALREWAQLADIPELHRLVAVLSLGSETSDLSRLVSEEAKTIRRESQRRLSETIEKRSQQVWVPVTVATLIPGVIFLCIPFLQALQVFSVS